MENEGPTASSRVASTTTIAVRTFSKTTAATYVGLGLFSLIFLIASPSMICTGRWYHDCHYS